MIICLGNFGTYRIILKHVLCHYLHNSILAKVHKYGGNYKYCYSTTQTVIEELKVMPDCIKDLESVVLPSLVKSASKIYISDIKSLTTAGENYGSILLSVNIVIENRSDGKTETIKAVAKAVPKNDFIKNFFMSSLTFKKELYFYQNVIPALKKFQTDQGMKKLVDFTAEFYGGRLSLDSNQQEYADEDAVILMENLKESGYQIMERTLGFDFDTTCLIIKVG